MQVEKKLLICMAYKAFKITLVILILYIFLSSILINFFVEFFKKGSLEIQKYNEDYILKYVPIL